jgi:hypothetical protein
MLDPKAIIVAFVRGKIERIIEMTGYDVVVVENISGLSE